MTTSSLSMQTYKVTVHGKGMLVRHWIFLRRELGFYATRFVDAESVEAAGAQALSQLRSEPRLLLLAIRAPILAIEEVEAVTGPAATLVQPGIVFYSGRSA